MRSDWKQDNYISDTGSASSAEETVGKEEDLKFTTSLEDALQQLSIPAAFADLVTQESDTVEKSTKGSSLKRCNFSKDRNTSRLKKIGSSLKSIIESLLAKILKKS